jgi:hypothetical protein
MTSHSSEAMQIVGSGIKQNMNDINCLCLRSYLSLLRAQIDVENDSRRGGITPALFSHFSMSRQCHTSNMSSSKQLRVKQNALICSQIWYIFRRFHLHLKDSNEVYGVQSYSRIRRAYSLTQTAPMTLLNPTMLVLLWTAKP